MGRTQMCGAGPWRSWEAWGPARQWRLRAHRWQAWQSSGACWCRRRTQQGPQGPLPRGALSPTQGAHREPQVHPRYSQEHTLERPGHTRLRPSQVGYTTGIPLGQKPEEVLVMGALGLVHCPGPRPPTARQGLACRRRRRPRGLVCSWRPCSGTVQGSP